MTGDKNKFTSLTLKDGGNIKFGDNSKGKIIGIGNDVSKKPVDGSQGVRQSGRPAKGNEVIGVALVWGRPRRLRCFC
jgi:hypothetical protein